jgi:hypothetical protein
MGHTSIGQLCRAVGLCVATVLISALVGSAALIAILAWPELGLNVHSIEDLLAVFFPILVFSMPWIALGLLLFGLPTDFVLRKTEVRHPLAYAGCGTVGGVVLMAILFGGDLPGPAALTGVGYGLVTSLVFWALFRRGRPAADEG